MEVSNKESWVNTAPGDRTTQKVINRGLLIDVINYAMLCT